MGRLSLSYKCVFRTSFVCSPVYACISYFHIAFLSGIIAVLVVIVVYCCLSHLLCSESVRRGAAEKGDIHFKFVTLVVETRSRSRRCKFR